MIYFFVSKNSATRENETSWKLCRVMIVMVASARGNGQRNKFLIWTVIHSIYHKAHPHS